MKKTLLYSFLFLLSLSTYAQGEFILTVQLPSGVTSTNFSITATASVDYTWETIPPGTSGSGTFTTINGGQNQITSLPDGALIRFLISPTNLNRITASTSVKPYYQTLEQWGTANWTSMQSMFNSATNLTITATDVPNLTNCTTMQSMFGSYPNSTVPMINTWNTSSVTNMQSLFDNSSFNDDISNWDVSNVTNFSTMFRHNYSFNQDISNWDVSNATTMHQMFASATTIPVPFNQDISGWDVSNVTDMSYMFQYCSFDQDLGGWDMSNVTNANTMLTGSGMSTENYDNTLIGWSTQSLINGVDLGASFLTYCNGEAARNQIINNFGWNITGDQLDCSSQCTVNVPDANFKAILLANTSINTNSDNEIQCSEASAFTGSINCSSFNISDMTGIEAFTSLTGLVCNSNLITSLDLTSNAALETLWCYSNPNLTSVDLSNCTNLIDYTGQFTSVASLDFSNCPNIESIICYGGSGNSYLTSLNLSNCSDLTHLEAFWQQLTTVGLSDNVNLDYINLTGNQLSSIDLSNNTLLTTINLGATSLTSIDVSNNPSLTTFQCFNSGQLTEVNVANGNTSALTTFSAWNTSNLVCIQIDDADTTGYNWSGSNFSFDSGVGFSNDCATFSNISKIETENMLDIYPNPTTSQLTIEVTQTEVISIYNLLGEVIFTTTLSSGNNVIDVSLLNPGVYMIQTDSGRTQKFIKE
ncbi:MAG: BspA family leucine-rich repeat surface protein [Flavobacteriales bacterium]|nr:BspA family leucine-rich repeat surface protein [Flavobacteriales bacterium]